NVRKAATGNGNTEPPPTGLFGAQTNAGHPSGNDAPSVDLGVPASPNYRVALTPSNGNKANAASNSRANTAETSSPSVEPTNNSASNPVVGGPIVSSRRASPPAVADSGATSTEQREASSSTKLAPASQVPTAQIVTATPTIDS